MLPARRPELAALATAALLAAGCGETTPLTLALSFDGPSCGAPEALPMTCPGRVAIYVVDGLERVVASACVPFPEQPGRPASALPAILQGSPDAHLGDLPGDGDFAVELAVYPGTGPCTRFVPGTTLALFAARSPFVRVVRGGEPIAITVTCVQPAPIPPGCN